MTPEFDVNEPPPAVIPTDPPTPADADRCGHVGPRGNACRLRKGHDSDAGPDFDAPDRLHAAYGDTWMETTPAPGDDGWRPPSMRDVPNLVETGTAQEADAERTYLFRESIALQRRAVAAAERQANALEGILRLVDHYVDMTFHRVNQ